MSNIKLLLYVFTCMYTSKILLFVSVLNVILFSFILNAAYKLIFYLETTN